MTTEKLYEKELAASKTKQFKLCKDCKHYKVVFACYGTAKGLAECAHPSLVSLVDGSAYRSCGVERGRDGHCKPEAALFEPKTAIIEQPKNFWQKLFKK